MVKCICINAKNMPADFKQKDLWVVENKEYHIERILYIPMSKTLGVELAEIDLIHNVPYTYFRCDRFAIYDLNAFLNLLRACKEESDANFNIDEMMEKLLKVDELELVD